MNQRQYSITGLADLGEFDWEPVTLDNLAGDWNEPPNPPEGANGPQRPRGMDPSGTSGVVGPTIGINLGRKGPMALESFIQATHRPGKGMMLASASGKRTWNRTSACERSAATSLP